MHCGLQTPPRSPSRGRKRQRSNPIIENSQNLQTTHEKKIYCSSSLENMSASTLSYADIQHCPTVQLTFQNMQQDPAELFLQLQNSYFQYGAVKLIACQEWQPPLTLRYLQKGITTRIQVLQQLAQGKAFQQKIEAYSLKAYETYALNFENKYTYKTKPKGKCQTEKDESQFWNLVTKPEYKDMRVKVQYAADLPVSRYSSGFPTTTQTGSKDEKFTYHTNLFNLNNTYKSRESLLKISDLRNEKISGVTHPWVYIGMKFSSFCWHVEDLYINSINYNHKGATKIWYIIPTSDKEKFDQFIKEKFSKTISNKPDLMHRITLMVDPLEILKAGIKVNKIYHTPRSYVFTFPKVYHAGFSTGYNVGEAINFLSHTNLPYMKEAYAEYSRFCGKKAAIFPYDWLICENYDNFNKYNPSQTQKSIISVEYATVVKEEYESLEKLMSTPDITEYGFVPKKALKYDKNMCAACRNYCYLSFIRCMQCGKAYCLADVKNSCCGDNRLYVRQPKDRRIRLLDLLTKCKKVSDEISEQTSTY